MSLERLHAAAEALGGTSLGDYLANAARRLEAGCTPAVAFELSGTAALRQRDALLAQAAALLDEPSAWRAAEMLRRRIVKLPHRHQPDAVGKLLLAAERCGTIPTSRRRIYDALTRADERIRGPDSDHQPRRIAAA